MGLINDVAAVIVEDRAEIEPAPADDLQVGEVGLLTETTLATDNSHNANDLTTGFLGTNSLYCGSTKKLQQLLNGAISIS